MFKKVIKNKFVSLSVVILVFMVTVVGVTYAYFTLTESNSSITATTGVTNLRMNVSKILPTSTPSNMIPQKEDALTNAVSSNYNCLDDNGEVVCQVYKVTVQNTANVNVVLDGFIEFSGIDNMPNLKWKLIESVTNFGNHTASKARAIEQPLVEDVEILANQSKTYYILFWVNEIESVQTDSGTFRVNINFQQSGLGVTSTVKPNVTLLKDVAPGSYVSYTGNNGCEGEACSGQNANYVADSTNGYCSSSSYQFSSSGWRVGYNDKDSAYLISAGSPECLKTYGEGEFSESYSTKFSISHGFTTAQQLVISSDGTLNFSSQSSLGFPGSSTSFSRRYIYHNSSYYYGETTSSEKVLFRKCILDIGTSTHRNSSTQQFALATSAVIQNGCSSFKLVNPTTNTLSKNNFTFFSSATSGNNLYFTKNSSVANNMTTWTSNKFYITSGDLEYGSPSVYNWQNFSYASAYTFNFDTGKYTLTSPQRLQYSLQSNAIRQTYPYSCGSATTCTQLYKIGSNSTGNSVSFQLKNNGGNFNSHIERLDEAAKKYCNSNYAYGGVCDENSVWAMNSNDFENITDSPLYYTSSSKKSCYNEDSNPLCGYGNDLIDNGGYYWNNVAYGTSTSQMLNWTPSSRYIYSNYTYSNYGLRPVIRMREDLVVTGGSGTEDDPYTIAPYSSTIS